MGKRRKRSKSSVQESKAISIFRDKINLDYIDVSEIKENDKGNDADGFITIYDKQSFLGGVLKVQIKGRSNLKSRICFKDDLLEYSKIITSPFLLILVDLDNKIVYWNHISHEHIQNEKVRITKKNYLSFNLLKLEKVEDDSYIQKWLNIAKEYQERIHNYPDKLQKLNSFQNVIAKKITLPFDTVIYFQQYTDKVNSLLENNFSFIKEILFKGTWKIGVAVLSSEKDFVFGLYTIPYGSIDLLIQEIDSAKWNKQNGYFAGQFLRKNYKKSDTLAKEFIIDYFKRILENNDLPLISDKVIEEYLYTTAFSICASLGLEEKESYSIPEIEDRLYKYFYRWVCAAAKVIDLDSEIKPQIHFDLLYMYARTRNHEIEKQMKLDEELPLPLMYLVSQDINFLKFKQYLNVAKVKGVLEVKNRLISIIPEVDSLVNQNSIWKIFTEEQRKKIILDFFTSSYSIIDSFCKHYNMPSEFYTELANADKIIITYELARDEYSFPIEIYVIFLKYKSGNFPKEKFSIQEKLIPFEYIFQNRTNFDYEDGIFKLLKTESYEESYILNPVGLSEFMKDYFIEKIKNYIKDES